MQENAQPGVASEIAGLQDKESRNTQAEKTTYLYEGEAVEDQATYDNKKCQRQWTEGHQNFYTLTLSFK